VKKIGKKIYEEIYLIPPILMSLATYFSMNILFECDAKTYFSFAKSLISGEDLNLLRGPIYPIFLLVAGSEWADSIYLILIIQWLMGVTIAIIITKQLEINNPNIKLLISIFISLNGYFFFGAKILLAEQLTMFLGILAIFFLLRFTVNYKTKDIITSIILASLAFLTRYEAMPILLVILCYSLLYNYKKRKIKLFLVTIIIPLVIIIGWSSIKKYHFSTKNEAGLIVNEFGSQLITSLDFAIREEQDRLINEGRNIDAQNISYFKIDNGPITKEAIDRIVAFLKIDNSLIQNKNKGLSLDKSYKKELETIWVPALSEPELPIKWFFSNDLERRSSQVVFLMNEVLSKQIGVREADKVLSLMAFELVKSNPNIMKLYLKKALNWYGIDLNKKMLIYNNNMRNSFWDAQYDQAYCASTILSERQFKQYSEKFSKKQLFDPVQNLTEATMDIFRLVFLLSLTVWFILKIIYIRIPNIKIPLLFMIHILVIIFLTFSQSGIHSKHSILPGAIATYLFVIIINDIANYKKLKLNKNE
jgi:hypothetical protein